MRVLIVKLSSLGDILMVLPTVCAIKSQTAAEIDWAVHPAFAPLVRCFAPVDRVIEIPRQNALKNCRAWLAALRKERYDKIIDLQGLFKSAVITRLARGNERIGPSFAAECSALFYGKCAKAQTAETRHNAEKAMDTLDFLGLPRKKSYSENSFKPLPKTNLRGSPRIAIAPVSRWKTKDWPAERFGELITKLAEKFPAANFAIVGGKKDAETAEKIISAANRASCENFCGKLTIEESLGLLKECDLLIGNDTGPVHMAAAVGTKCLVVFGPTHPEWTGPWGRGHRVIQTALPCVPCLKRQCKFGAQHPCMMQIAADSVAATAIEMLAAEAGAWRAIHFFFFARRRLFLSHLWSFLKRNSS